MNTSEVKRALTNHFDKKAYALLWEVGNATGMNCTRHCDALVMSLWPSRGLHLSGIEIKVSRQDWTKELKDPGKSESILQFCDYWYLAVGDKSIVADGELPETWGLLIPNGKGGMRISKQAPKLTPNPVNRGFLAAIMRKVVEQTVNNEVLQETARDAYQRGLQQAQGNQKYELERLRQLATKVKEFETASGLDIQYGWRGTIKIGNAVRIILDGGLDNYTGLKQARDRANAFVKDVDELIKTKDVLVVKQQDDCQSQS